MIEIVNLLADKLKLESELAELKASIAGGVRVSACNGATLRAEADGPVYRVKKLEWEGSKLNGYRTKVNRSYCITYRKGAYIGYEFGFYSHFIRRESLEEAKAACQAHYEAEMMKNLVEVQTMSTSLGVMARVTTDKE